MDRATGVTDPVNEGRWIEAQDSLILEQVTLEWCLVWKKTKIIFSKNQNKLLGKKMNYETTIT